MSAKSLLRYRGGVGGLGDVGAVQLGGGVMHQQHHQQQHLLTINTNTSLGELSDKWEGGAGGKKSPTGSLTSEAPSSSPGSTPTDESGLEDLDEGLEDILSSNPSCNLCGHTFYSAQDFLQHVRLHFSSGQRSNSRPTPTQEHSSAPAHGGGPVPSHGSRPTSAPGAQPPFTSPGGAGGRSPPTYQQTFNTNHEQTSQHGGYDQTVEGEGGGGAGGSGGGGGAKGSGGGEGPRRHHQQPDPYELFQAYSPPPRLPAAAELQMGLNMTGPLPYLPPYPTLPSSPYPSLPSSPYTTHPASPYPALSSTPYPALSASPYPGLPFRLSCMMCPATFDKQEQLFYHFQLHHQYTPQETYARPAPPAKRPRGTAHGPLCGCGGCRPAKRAKKPVEDIDPETLKKISALEWERKHGYWCTKCSTRFSSQSALVDHMSYSVEHNYTNKSSERTTSK